MIGEIFNLVLLRPFLNAMLLLYHVLGNNYALAIVALTVVLRLITQPLMANQLKMSKKMSELQPRMKELEKKYANDKERLAQEQMKLYKEAGINPFGGCLPMLAQFPIWIALYQSIIQTLGRTPLQLLSLSKHLYGAFASLPLLIPLSSKFLWLDLARPDPFYIIPILTAVTMFISQKMITPPASEGDSSQQMNKSMLLMMPLMFGYFTMSLASGLGVYFIISNVVGIVVQYFTTGWGGLDSVLPQRVRAVTQPVGPASKGTAAIAPKGTTAPVQKGTKSGSRKKKR